MQKLLKKLSKIASSLLSLAIISSSLFIAIPTEEANALISAGQMDFAFRTGTGFTSNGQIVTSDIQSDGKIIVGGQIVGFEDTSLSNIARLNTDASLDHSFNVGTGTNNHIWKIKIQDDQKILVGGDFTSFNGTSVNRLVRLNSDGSIDNSFNIGTGANSLIHAIEIQSDNKILIGGNFTSFNGTSVNRLVRLNSDGSIDSSFDIGTGANLIIYTIGIQSDNKILIGGRFTSYNGSLSTGLARLNTNGSYDGSLNVGVGIGGNSKWVRDLSPQSDGRIIITGNFDTYQGVARTAIARVDTDGSLDTSFNVGTGATFSEIGSHIIQNDGKVVIVGGFGNYNGTTSERIARINTDGSIDSSFNMNPGFNGGAAWTSLLLNDGRIFVGGLFSSYKGYYVGRIIILNPDGSIDTSFTPILGANGRVRDIKRQSDGKLLIGGTFTEYAGISSNRIARVNIDGSLDDTFDVGTGPNGDVVKIGIQSDGKPIIVGWFSSYNGTNRNRIARLNLDGSLDTSFNIGTGASSDLWTLDIQSDDKVVIGGQFGSYNGTISGRIARISTDGSIDTSLNTGTGFNSTVRSIKIQNDGKLLVVGDFTSYNGTAINRIARLNSDGSLDSSFTVGTGVNSSIDIVELQTDGKILIGGNFTLYNGITRNKIARLNTDGSLDTTFNPGTGVGGTQTVQTIKFQHPDYIYAGGTFSSFNGISRNRIVRLTSSGDVDTTFNIGGGVYATSVGNRVWAIELQSTSRIAIGGDIELYNWAATNNLVLLKTETLYQADNLDPSLDLGINGTSLKVGTENGSRNPSEPVTLKATGNVPLSDFVVDFSNGDVDFSGVTAGSDAASGKAFLSGLNNTAIPELSPTHTLYIPKLVGQTSVHICPDATQMSEVFMGCSNGYTLNYGTASNLSIVNISGQDYWRVTGLTGTGGLGTYSNGVSLTITPNNGLESVAQEVDVTYTSGGGFVNGDVIQLTWDAGITLANCATPTTDADGDLTNDGSSSVVGQTYTYTYTGNATSSVDLCMSVAGLSGNYAVTLNDDNGSFSSALYYINPEGGDVNVIANIAPTLSFNIRNIDDSADLNVCNFGDVSTSTPIPNTNGTVDSGECGYSLAVGTNSSSGFTMQMSSNGALTNGVSNINNILNNGTWSAGEEAYGIAQVIVGQTGRDPLSGDYDQSLTREGNFLTDTTPVPTTATDFVTYTDGVQYEAGNLDTDVTKVIHGLVVGAGTPAGSYSQVVTYTVTASF
jgi:uncharacterized delta-60 repeat protein